MTTPFDASLVYTGPISEDVLAAQHHEVERSMRMLGALANAKLHATREMERWVLSCNRFIWGEMPSEVREPVPGEIEALLEQIGPEHSERLLRESRLAAEQRSLIALISQAEVEAHALREAQREEEAMAEAEQQARLEALWAEQARVEAEQVLREEFEAFDAAGKEARFQAWRDAQRR